MISSVWDLKSQLKKYGDADGVFDCMIAEFLLSYGKNVSSQEQVLAKYKVHTLDGLAALQKEKLDQLPKIKSLYYDVELPLVKVLWQMEQNGITLDTECLKKVGEEITTEIQKTEEKIKKEIGFDINLNSSIQVGNYLAEKEGVPLKKTKTGRFATNESELSLHKDTFPIIQDLLKYRELTKLSSTYVMSLIDKIDTKSRVHTTYHQAAVNTGRLASTNPNLQNIPVTSVFGQKIKSCFIASPKKTLLSFDYSQQELRILAHLSDEDKLIKAFQEEKDVHKITASRIFKTHYDEVTKEQRMVGKTINFGIIYGMSSYGLSMSLQIPVDEAQKFIDAFYETYPKIKIFYDQYFKDALTNKYVETILGRRRDVFEYPGQKIIDNNTRRVLLNYPIQGSAADLIKKAMVQIQKDILNNNPDIQLLLQIHDDLVFEVPEDKKIIRDLTEKVTSIMCMVYPLKVPIEVDVKIGCKWGELEKYSNA
jgi:DNA polymerase I